VVAPHGLCLEEVGYPADAGLAACAAATRNLRTVPAPSGPAAPSPATSDPPASGPAGLSPPAPGPPPG